MKNDALGLKGEQAVERYLRKKGYKILDRRWKCRLGELDLVTEKGGEVVFVEVKTRSSNAYGGALAAVGWTKARRLRAAAYTYINAKGLHSRPFRIDVVAVTVSSPGRARLEHLPSAICE